MPSINIKIKRQLPDPMEGERAMHGWGGRCGLLAWIFIVPGSYNS